MNDLNAETAVYGKQQLNEINNVQILLNIESHLKSIADSLDKITENGIDIYKKNWT